MKTNEIKPVDALELTCLANVATVEQLRPAVMSYMHYDGSRGDSLNRDEWTEVYLLADGFGTITLESALDLEWDWSHVRDSSLTAIGHMFAKIKELRSRAIKISAR